MMPSRSSARTIFKVCVCLATLITSAWAAPQFQTGLTLGVGKNPTYAAAGDFNKDGKVDLVVTNRGETSVDILLGKGDGTFQPAVKYKAGGQSPSSVAVGDFNGDGNLDLAVGLAPDLAILLGNGDGTFQSPSVMGDHYVSFITTADFNHDGKLDLLYVSSFGVQLRLGNGNGTFQGPTQVAATAPGDSLAVADLNGDGNLDLIVPITGQPGFVGVLLGDGKGGFGTENQYAVGAYPVAVAVADFNGDGKLDIAASNSISPSSQTGSITVLLGKGDGTFQTGHTFNSITDIQPKAMVTADFNQDGKADLAVLSLYSNDITVLLGKGDGTFQRGMNWAVGTTPFFPAVSDFNGDGLPDLATPNYGSNDVTILLGHAGGSFSGARDIVVGYFPYFGAAGDFNEDGKVDLVSSNQGQVAVMLAQSNGFFAPPVSYTVPGPINPQVAVADLNSDPHLDLVTVNQVDGPSSVSVLLGNGNGTFQPAVNYNVGTFAVALTIGDFNGDQIPDLAVANLGETQNGNVSLLLGNGDGTFQPATTVSLGTFFPYSIVAGDFNGDGKLDLAAVENQTVVVILGNGDGTFSSPITTSGIGQAVFAAVGDLNGDGKLDMVTANSYSNTVSILLGNGDGTFQTPTSYTPGPIPTGVAIADFNGDGKLDIGVSNSGTLGGTGSFAVLEGNGDGTFVVSKSAGIGCNPYSALTADFNGDGKPDMALFNIQSSEATILINTGH